jgi:hypothetical protein
LFQQVINLISIGTDYEIDGINACRREAPADTSSSLNPFLSQGEPNDENKTNHGPGSGGNFRNHPGRRGHGGHQIADAHQDKNSFFHLRSGCTCHLISTITALKDIKRHEKEKQRMKSKQIMALGLAFMFALTLTGEAMARGGNGGGNGSGNGQRMQTQTKTSTQSSVNRPEGSQRRDGTFQTTGTTASGATTRPDNGKGVRDGSRLNTTTTAPVAPVVTE